PCAVAPCSARASQRAGGAGPPAAAKFAGTRRIATQLVLHEADWIELLVGLAIRNDKLAEAVEWADLLESVTAAYGTCGRQRAPVVHDVRAARGGRSSHVAVGDFAPSRAGAMRCRLGKRHPAGVDDLMRRQHGAHGDGRRRPRIDD